MSSSYVSSFLESEIFVNGQIVTYRSLSRQKLLHVNCAKNKLAKFYADNRRSARPIFAVFQLSGEATTSAISQEVNGSVHDDAMAVDEDAEQHAEEREDLAVTKVLLVDELNLEHAKASFSKITSCHIYSLSAAPVRDTLQLSALTPNVRQIDASSGDDFSQIVGRTVSALVKAGDFKPPPIASSSKLPAQPASQLKPNASKLSLKAEPKGSFTQTVTEKPKPKATGKLDWGKAKLKEPNSEVKKEVEVTLAKENGAKKDDVKRRGSKVIVKEEEAAVKVDDDISQRGTKRKSDSFQSNETSESEVEVPKPQHPTTSINAIRTKKGVVLSESEDSDINTKTDKTPAPTKSRWPINPMRSSTKARSQSNVTDSDAEKSVRAMFDIDDSEVIKVSRPSTSKPPPQSDDEDVAPPTASEPELDADVDMDAISDIDSTKVENTKPKPKPRKRKEKKEVPVGRNGFKKKRTVKSRMTVDAKGYMVTEDYSSYESVDEEEPDFLAKPKAKAKPKAPVKSAIKSKLKAGASFTSTAPSSDDGEGSEPKVLARNDQSESEAEHPFRAEPAAKLKPTKTYPGQSSAAAKKSGSGAGGGKASPAVGQRNLMNFFGKPKK